MKADVLTRLAGAEDYPANARQVLSDLRDAHQASLAAAAASSQGAHDAMLLAIASLDKQLDRDLSAQERADLNDRIMELVQLAAAKDAETKGFIRGLHTDTTKVALAGAAVLAVAGVFGLNPKAGKLLFDIAGEVLPAGAGSAAKALPKVL